MMYELTTIAQLQAGGRCDPSLRSPTMIGLGAMIFALGGTMLWSYSAPLASATITTGAVVVESSRKTVQHPEGGTIGAIYTRDGDRVRAGQILLSLDDARLTTTRAMTSALLAVNVAQHARLRAEREQATDVEFSDPDSGLRLAEFPSVVAAQRQLFRARRVALEDKIASLNAEGREIAATLAGFRQQLAAQTLRLHLTQQELANADELARAGSGTRQRVLEVSRARAELLSGIAALESHVGETESRAERTRCEIERARAVFLESVETELQQADREQLDLAEKLTNIDAQLRRLQIVAPVAGKVVSQAVHTVGGVILPGMPILDIVPQDDQLLIETQVRPADAVSLSPGLPVDIRLSGPQAKRSPRLVGHIKTISADRVSDRLRATEFFIVRVEFDQRELRAFSQHEVGPGMPVDLMIYRGEQTLVDYLAAPLVSFFSKSLRE